MKRVMCDEYALMHHALSNTPPSGSAARIKAYNLPQWIVCTSNSRIQQSYANYVFFNIHGTFSVDIGLFDRDFKDQINS